MKDIRHLDQVEIADIMNQLADAVESTLERNCLDSAPYLVLLMNDHPIGQYASNVVERSTLVTWARQTADMIEANKDLPN
jgi:hypothetical protein